MLLKVIFCSRTVEQVSQYFLPNFSSVTVSPCSQFQWDSSQMACTLRAFSLIYCDHCSSLSPPACLFFSCLIYSPLLYTQAARFSSQEDKSTQDIMHFCSDHSNSLRHSSHVWPSYLFLQLSIVKSFKDCHFILSLGVWFTHWPECGRQELTDKNWAWVHKLIRNIYTYRRKIHKWSSHIPWKGKARRRGNDDGCQNLSQKERNILSIFFS